MDVPIRIGYDVGVVGDPSFDAEVKRTRQLLQQYGTWIRKYRGGLPAGVMASWMRSESDGQADLPGDPSLGEWGLMQIAAYVPPMFGWPAEARFDPENNVAIAALEYALEAVRWKIAFPSAVRLGSADSWRLARLVFAVGRAGSRTLAKFAGQLEPGDVYGSILRTVDAGVSVPLGTQSADLVAHRVRAIARQWAVGEAADGSRAGQPQYIPDPPAGPYVIPSAEAPYFVKPMSGAVALALAGLATALLWRFR